jgi:hypothetical protein
MRHRLVRLFTGAFSRRDRERGMAPSDDAQIDMEQGLMIVEVTWLSASRWFK